MKLTIKQSLVLFLVTTAAALVVFAIAGQLGKLKQSADRTGDNNKSPLRIVVMDPLSDQLACACVEGYAQRKYDNLAEYLEKQLSRPVQVGYAEILPDILSISPGNVDFIIGKESSVLFDAGESKIGVHPIARLTDKNGSTDVTGLFVVRNNDPARSIEDLKGYKILFGPEWEVEKSKAAIEALNAKGISAPKQIQTTPSCNGGALAVVEKEADAAVISSYALVLLEGCDTIDKGSLRVVGQTAGVPFVTVFANNNVPAETEDAFISALLSVNSNPTLLEQMESKSGFVKAEWTDWRGPNRDAISPYIPAKLPAKPTFLWKKPMKGAGMSGIAATHKYVVVTDKNKDFTVDIFHCLNADTGKEIWAIEYPAEGEMDFTNAPRANPVIHDGLVYLLGAFGDLNCVELSSGKIVWKKNIVKEFKAELVAWGMCSAPLIVDDKLIVNPGAKNASIVALDRRTGKVIWKTPGEPASYSCFILGKFGNVRQIVGYDSISLGGWDPETGKRLWQLLPEEEGDFNVPTPINFNGKLLVSTENNGTRLYGFDDDGRIQSKPLARNLDLSPDTSTPVLIDGLLFGCFAGLYCIDVSDGLKTLYSSDDDAFYDYASLAAGNGRVLILSVESELVLLAAEKERFTEISRMRLFEDKRTEVWSHPALLGNRMYVRSMTEIGCLLLDK